MKRYREDSAFRDRMISAAHNRRVGLLGLDGITQPRELISFLVARDQGICGICNDPIVDKTGPMQASPDHILPIARGGKHKIENLQASHLGCNRSKGARVDAENR